MGFAKSLQEILRGRVAKGYKYKSYPAYALTLADAEKFGALAGKFGIPPEWLANLVNYESAGTFNPAIRNSIGATGLIQFLPSTAQKLGTTTAQLATMSFQQQLTYVEKYLTSFLQSLGVKRGVFDKATGKVTKKFTQTDLFMMIFYPDAVGKPGYLFPAAVSLANAGIKQPLDYAKKALSAATTPFRQAVDYAKEVAGKTASYTKRHWLPITVTLVSITGITLLCYRYRKQLGFVK